MDEWMDHKKEWMNEQINVWMTKWMKDRRLKNDGWLLKGVDEWKMNGLMKE